MTTTICYSQRLGSKKWCKVLVFHVIAQALRDLTYLPGNCRHIYVNLRKTTLAGHWYEFSSEVGTIRKDENTDISIDNWILFQYVEELWKCVVKRKELMAEKLIKPLQDEGEKQCFIICYIHWTCWWLMYWILLITRCTCQANGRLRIFKCHNSLSCSNKHE